MQQQLCGLHAAIVVEPALHDVVAQKLASESRLIP